MTNTDSERDVVDILTSDHSEVAELIGRILSTDDGEQRRDMADTVISELMRHAVAEEMFVYPAVKEHLPDGEAVVEHDKEEHEDLVRTMKELEAVDASDPRFTELVHQLKRTFADHVADEEAEQFPQLRAHIPRAELVEIAGKVENAKKLAPTRPHPGAPHNQAFHKTVGPGIGLVDRLRDKLTGREG